MSDEDFDPIKRWSNENDQDAPLKKQERSGAYRSPPIQISLEPVGENVVRLRRGENRKYYLSTEEHRKLLRANADQKVFIFPGYVPLSVIAALIGSGWEVRVWQSPGGEDITRDALQKIVFYLARSVHSEEELRATILAFHRLKKSS